MSLMDHNKGRDFLLQLRAIFDTFHIPHFLIQGTALGAYRDGGFTPTEKDIDIGFLSENFRREVGVIVNWCLRSNFEVETRYRHKPFDFCHTVVLYKDGIKADLVSFHKGVYNGAPVRYAITPDDPVNVPHPYAIVHPASMLETCGRVDLFGRGWNVPCPIEDYLKREYGDDWKTPRDDHVSRARVYDFLKLIGKV